MLPALALTVNVITAVVSLQCSKTRCQGLKLTDIMADGYDKGSPPSINGKPAEVEVYASILNIRAIEEKTMSFHTDVFLHQKWVDSRLIFPENVSASNIVLDVNWRREIWTPDILFKNSLEGKVQNIIIPYSYMKLYKDGTVFFASRLSLQLSCEMDLRKFPHDTQACDVAIMALVHTDNEMKLYWRNGCGLMITKNVLLPQFDVINSSCNDCSRKYDIGTFSCLKGTISLKRRTGYYNIYIYIPSILIVAMSMLTFWMPPEAVPARVTLGVTTLLTIVTLQFQTSLPSVSYIVAMNIWMSCCIAFVFCSLLEFAFVLWLNQNRKNRPQPASADSRLNIELHNLDKKTPKHRRIKLFFKKLFQKQPNLDRIARFVFPLGFLCQIILYSCIYGL